MKPPLRAAYAKRRSVFRRENTRLRPLRRRLGIRFSDTMSRGATEGEARLQAGFIAPVIGGWTRGGGTGTSAPLRAGFCIAGRRGLDARGHNGGGSATLSELHSAGRRIFSGAGARRRRKCDFERTFASPAVVGVWMRGGDGGGSAASGRLHSAGRRIFSGVGRDGGRSVASGELHSAGRRGGCAGRDGAKSVASGGLHSARRILPRCAFPKQYAAREAAFSHAVSRALVPYPATASFGASKIHIAIPGAARRRFLRPREAFSTPTRFHARRCPPAPWDARPAEWAGRSRFCRPCAGVPP